MEPPPTPTNLNPNHRLTKPRYGASATIRASESVAAVPG